MIEAAPQLQKDRPHVSERLVDAMREWENWLNSGSSPAPSAGGELCSVERLASSGKDSSLQDHIWEEVRSVGQGVRVDDAFRKLAPTQQVCCRTHFLWSAWTPLIRARLTPWSEVRKVEAEHAAMPEAVYERVLINTIAEMERACG